MKNTFAVKIFAGTTGFLLFCSGVVAQTPGLDAAVMKLFGDKSFTTDVDITVLDSVGATNIGVFLAMSKSDADIRSEMDMGKATGALMSPQVKQQLLTLGISRVITIAKPETKTITMIYPGLASFLQMPLPQAQLNAMTKEPKIDKTEVGKETLNGHRCVKSKVIVTDDHGQKKEFLLWAATDLNNFPVKIESTSPQGKTIVTCKNSKLEKPDTKLFEPPAGYTKYVSQQEFESAVMAKKSGAPK